MVAAIVVIGLAELAERSSTKMAGLLAGLPVGSALVLFFYGLEYGSDYVASVTSYNLLGLTASLSFVSFYYLGSKLSQRFSVMTALSFGLLAYLSTAYLLSFFRVDSALLPAFILLSMILTTTVWFKEIKEVQGSKSGTLNTKQVLGRGSVAVFFVLLASYAPQFFNAQMAGILSSFPSSLLPLLLILHLSQGKEVVHSVIKHLPLGYIGVMTYSLVVGSFYLNFEIYWGTLLALMVSTLYLVGLIFMSQIRLFISGVTKSI